MEWLIPLGIVIVVGIFMMFNEEHSNLERIKANIEFRNWFWFGTRAFMCPARKQLTRKLKKYYTRKGKLPKPCHRCYQVLLHWDGNFTDDNVNNFVKLIDSIRKRVWGRMDTEAATFFFTDAGTAKEFAAELERLAVGFAVTGTISWRLACAAYQELAPALWRSPQEFRPGADPVSPQ